MRQISIFLLAVLMVAATALGQNTKSPSASAPQAQQPPTLAATIDRDISGVEKQIIDAAEAMPEDKFNFSPESLNIPGDDYKGVRTFAQQVKHVAAVNYIFGATILNEKPPVDVGGESGPDSVKSKAEIMQFLKFTRSDPGAKTFGDWMDI